MLKSLNYIKDRFKKCRVADGVYKDEGEVDAESDEEKKKYALFKIIDFIKNKYKNEREIQGEAMDKLKKITNNCDSIIEKRFDLPDYLFKQKVLTQTYYDLHIYDPKTFKNNTFKDFFEQNDLLNRSYINDNDDEAIIFKLSNENLITNLYIRLSRMNLQDRQLNESLEENIQENLIKIFKIDTLFCPKPKVYRYVLISNNNNPLEKIETGTGPRTEQETTIHNFNKISINNEELANIFKKKLQQKGGIGKKTIKNKSKPLKNTILQKKEILGKDMRIYKINGSKKEYVKYKGNLISISDYKKIIKLKKN